MTISTAYSPDSYTATAGQTDFAYTFRILADTDIDVYVNGTLQTLTTDYTVSDVGEATGGTVAFVSGLTLSDAVVLQRSTALTQAVNLAEGDDFPAETLETALDKLTMIGQEHGYYVEDLETAVAAAEAAQTAAEAAEVAAEAAQTAAELAETHAELAETNAEAAWASIDAISADISAVAGIAEDVTTCAADIAAIVAAPTEAANAAQSAIDAAASAAGVNLPSIGAGDALKLLRANAGETGFELASLATVLASLASGLKQFTWDISTTGDQEINLDNATGTPTLAIFMGGDNSSGALTFVGLASASTAFCVTNWLGAAAGRWTLNNTKPGQAYVDAGSNYASFSAAFSSGKVTITKAKTGSPTGSLYCAVATICI